jgi:hypothetical protein
VRCKLKDNFMTKVRVSEETSNLSHLSNLISTVRLENPSPSLMRSIRARGRTHSWVVQAFLLREQEREERGRAGEERGSICRARCTSQGNKLARILRQGTTINADCMMRISRGRTTIFHAQKLRETAEEFLRSLACIPRLSYIYLLAQKSR